MGCVAMSEPAFWAGFDRGSVDGFRDYFRQLTEVRTDTGRQYGIQHYTLAVHQRQGSGERLAVSRSDRDDSRISGQTERVGNWRNRV